MHLMFENGIREGLTQVSMRYAQTKNKKIDSYNKTKKDSWIIYHNSKYTN